MKKQKPTVGYKKAVTRPVSTGGGVESSVTSLDISTLNKYSKLNVSPEVLKKAVEKGFRLGATRISDYFSLNEEDKNDKILLEEEELESLKTLQRVYQITPCHEAIAVLLQMEIHSAYDVISMPEEDFATSFEKKYREIFTDEKLPTELAALIHRKATQITRIA